jgi:type IV pilus assembly protein PilM
MGLLQKKFIGIEVSHGGLAAVLLQQQSDKLILKHATRISLPAETMQHSLKEPQILEPTVFVNSVQEVWEKNHFSIRQIALSVPDSAGLFLLTSLEDPWKHRDEAKDMIRWKLGKRFGIDPNLLQLDFQLLERRSNGATDLLVALIHKAVILQYEDLFIEAGLQPILVGFHTLHLLRLFEHLIADDERIVTLYDNALGTFGFAGKKPVFCRVKCLSDSPVRHSELGRELNASLSACRNACGGSISETCHVADPPDYSPLAGWFADGSGDHLHRLSNEMVIECDSSLNLSSIQLFEASAALGAAMGGLQCKHL